MEIENVAVSWSEWGRVGWGEVFRQLSALAAHQGEKIDENLSLMRE